MLTEELIVEIVHLQRADEHNLLAKDDVPPSTEKKENTEKKYEGTHVEEQCRAE